MIQPFHPMNIQAFPVARGMIRLAYDSNLAVFIRYMCLWSAFNNIYQYLSDQDGFGSRLVYDTNRQPRIREVYGYFLPRVETEAETISILRAIHKLNRNQLKAWLRLPEVTFFVKRTPQGVRGKRFPNLPGLFDKKDQRINGVLNRTRTVDPLYPYYAPIDTKKYESFLQGDLTYVDLLSNQLVMLLYTVRNNLMHGHKEVTSDNDGEVVRQAYPLLEYLIGFFVNIREYRRVNGKPRSDRKNIQTGNRIPGYEP